MRLTFLKTTLLAVLAASATMLSVVHAESDETAKLSQNIPVVSTLPQIKEADEQLMATGQWRDPRTGLIWMRCSIGQKWTGVTCTGDPIELNWQDANDYFSQKLFNENGFAGQKNWRLPSIKELSDVRLCSTGWQYDKVSRLTTQGRVLVQADAPIMTDILNEKDVVQVPFSCEDNTQSPTLDTIVFPATPTKSFYWSSSASVENPNDAWVVYFYYGNVYYNKKKNKNFARAVRDLQPSDAQDVRSKNNTDKPEKISQDLTAIAPKIKETDEQLMATGQWRDPKTGLIWMRCVIGQTWTGEICTGKAIELVWRDAIEYFSPKIFNEKGFAGHTNWRLPTIRELADIRYCSGGWDYTAKTVSKLTLEGRKTVKENQIKIEKIPTDDKKGILEVAQQCKDIDPTAADLATNKIYQEYRRANYPVDGMIFPAAWNSGCVFYTSSSATTDADSLWTMEGLSGDFMDFSSDKYPPCVLAVRANF